MQRDDRQRQEGTRAATAVAEAPTPTSDNPEAAAHAWAQQALGHREVRDGLGQTDGLSAVVGDELRLATVGIAGQSETLSSNAEVQQVMRRARGGPVPGTNLPATTGGRPLPAPVQARMEQAFGHDFGHVRIHTDRRAADALTAEAFALGSHLFFRPDAWAPGTEHGDKVLAHELTHVVQFDQGRLGGAPGVSRPDDPHEREAYDNEIRIAGRLGSEADVLDERVERLAPAPVDGVVQERIDQAGAALSERASDMGAGTFLPAMRRSDGPTSTDSKFTLNLVGFLIELTQPTPDPQGRPVRVPIARTVLPGLYLDSVEVRFDDGAAIKGGTVTGKVSLPPWVDADVSLAMDAEGRISPSVHGVRLRVPDVLDTLADLAVSARGIAATATVTADQIVAKHGITLQTGSLRLRLDPETGLSGQGSYNGSLPGVGDLTLHAELAGGSLTGRMEAVLTNAVTPVPGVRVKSGSLRGRYDPARCSVTGDVSVNVHDWAEAEVSGTYDLAGRLWSVRGTLLQIADVGKGGWSLTKGRLDVGVERNSLMYLNAAGDLKSPKFAGRFDGTYAARERAFTGSARVKLTEELPLGTSGAKLRECEGLLTIEANDLKSIAGRFDAEIPWKGSPAVRAVAQDAVLVLDGPKLTGQVTLTALRDLTFGPDNGLRVIVAKDSTGTAQITDNTVGNADGTIAFRLIDPKGDVGNGKLALSYDADKGIGADGVVDLLADYGFPDREAGPAFLKKGAHIEFDVVGGELKTLTLKKTGFALIAPHKGGVGAIEGTIDGTLYADRGIVDGTIDAAVTATWPMVTPWGSITLDQGGTVSARVDMGDLKKLDLDVPFHATVTKGVSVALEGRVKGKFDPDKDAFDGHADAKLTEDANIPLKNEQRVVVYAEGSDFDLDFGFDGVKKVGFSAKATYFRGEQAYLAGDVTNATYDVVGGKVGFTAGLELKDKYERKIKGHTLLIKPGTKVSVTVADNALTKLGGDVAFEVHDKAGLLLTGSLKDVAVDVVDWTFTGAWTAKTERDYVHPKPGEKEDVPGLRLVVAKGAGTSGRVEKNELKQVKAIMAFHADLLEQKLGHGHLDVDWDLEKDEFTGTVFLTLDDNFPLSGAKKGGDKPEDWSVWLVRDSNIDIGMTKNVLQKAHLFLGAVAVRGEDEVLAEAVLDGDYKLGDQAGFSGKAVVDVLKPLPLSKGDRFSYTLQPQTKFTAQMAKSKLGPSSGKFLMTGEEEGKKKLFVTANGDYAPGKGITGTAQVDVREYIDMKGAEYTVRITAGSGAKAEMVEGDLVRVDGQVTAFAREGEADPFLRAQGRVAYSAGDKPDATVEAGFSVLDGIDFGAKSKKYGVELRRGAGGNVKVEHDELQSLSGRIPVMVKDPADLVHADLQGDYTHGKVKQFTGVGVAGLERQVPIAENVGARKWSFYLEKETSGTASVRANDLENVDGTMVMTVKMGGDPILSIRGKGTYAGAGTKLSLAEGQVKILDDVPLGTVKGYAFSLRKDGEAKAKLGDNGLERLFGKIGIAVTKGKKAFADVDLEGSWTDKQGFTGNGDAKLYESLDVSLGKYGLIIDPSDGDNLAKLFLDKGDVTGIGGHIRYRFDKKGQVGKGKPFLQGELKGFYDFKTFSGDGWAEVMSARKLATTKAGDELWVLDGTRVDIGIQANDLKSLGAGIRLELRDPGAYLEVVFEKGRFDPKKGEFFGKGEARVKRDKRLFGKESEGYAFYLEKRDEAGARADIANNDITRVSGKVPFVIKDKKGDFIRGFVAGSYENGKVNGKGEVKLAREERWRLGGSKAYVRFAENSGGEGQVTDSKLTRLAGRLDAYYQPDGKTDLFRLDAKGEYDAVHNRIGYLQGDITMLRPMDQLLGGLIVVEELTGKARFEGLALKWVEAKGKAVVPKLNNSSGKFNVGWKADGGDAKYHADGELDLKIFDNKAKKRSANIDKLKVVLDEAGKLAASAEFMYRMSELIGGNVRVVLDQRLDPEISGSFVSEGRLAKGGNLFALELPAIKAPPIPIWGPAMLEYGAKAGLSLSLDDLTYKVPVVVEPFRPLSSKLEVPPFSAALELKWGMDFKAAAAAWLKLVVPFGVGELGAGVKGALGLSTEVDIAPTGRVWSDDGGFHGEVGVGFDVRPELELEAIPYVYAELPLFEKPINKDFDSVKANLGELLSFAWNTMTEFGDRQQQQQGQAEATQQRPTPDKRETVKHKSEPDLGLGTSKGAVKGEQGGPDFAGSGDVGKDQPLAKGGLGDKFGSLKKDIELIQTLAKGVAGLAYFIDIIKDLIKWFTRFGIPGLIINLVWKLFTKKISWDGLKKAANAVWDAVQAAAKLLTDAMPDWLNTIVKYLSGDKPGLLDALFGADDEMRKSVRRGEHKKANPDMLRQMVNEMLSIYCSEADEECTLELLQYVEKNRSSEFVPLVRSIEGGPDRLMDKLDGHEDTEMSILLHRHGISYSTGW